MKILEKKIPIGLGLLSLYFILNKFVSSIPNIYLGVLIGCGLVLVLYGLIEKNLKK